MRYILIILLFIASEAGAQMPMFHAHNFTREQLLLDLYPGATAGYSLRKIRMGYTGSAIRVRRSSDNAEQDIGFTANGDLDTVSLKSFVGANTGYVKIWYDQSGNNNYAQELAAGVMIVSSGTVLRMGSKPAVDFSNTPASLSAVNESPFDFTNTFSVFTAAQPANIAGAQTLLNKGNNNNFQVNGWYADIRKDIVYISLNRTGANDAAIASSATDTNPMLLSWTFDTGNAVAAKNGTIGNTYSSLTGATLNNDGLLIGQYETGFSSNGFDGRCTEIIIYPTGQASNRTGIEANINSYYSIY